MPPSDPPAIGYVLKRFPRFSETFILNEILAHEAAGAKVHVFSLLEPPEEPRHARLSDLRAEVTVLKGLPRDALPAPTGRDAPLFIGKSDGQIAGLQTKARRIADIAGARGIRHLHAHFGSDATTVACLAARQIQGTFSYTAHARDIYHTYVDRDADRAMRRTKLNSAAFTVTVSDYNARHLSLLCPEAETRIRRLYNGIDLAAFAPAPASGREPGHLVAVGRFVEKKGFPILLDALSLLRARGVRARLSLVGAGPQEEALRAMISALGLGPHVTMTGALPQERLVDLLATAEAAVLPCIVTGTGDRDGLPTVLLEAMARALPVVTTTVSGGPEIVDDSVTGKLCPPGDAIALADALRFILADRDRAFAMGMSGRRRAESLFDLTANAAQLRGWLTNPASAVRGRVAA